MQKHVLGLIHSTVALCAIMMAVDASAHASTIYSENFSSAAIGTAPAGWTNLGAVGFSIAADNPVGEYDSKSNYLYTTAQSNSFNFISSPVFSSPATIQTGQNVTMSLGFELVGSSQGRVDAYLWDSAATSVATGKAYDLRFDNGSLTIIRRSNGSESTLAQNSVVFDSFTTGTYYVASLEIASNGILTATIRTASGSQIASVTATDSTITSFDSIVLNFRHTTTDANSYGYRVSDIAVSTAAVPEPAGLGLIGMSLGVLLLRRRRQP